jgi:nicotinamide-nucleotide amidase
MRHTARAPRATAAVDALRTAGATLATAESLTGGQLAVLMTEIPGSSEVYRGGVVAYATDVKVGVLDVPDALVEEHGVVSEECARAMARGVRRLTGATYGVSTTGVAGPERQEGKPVGTVFVALAGPDGRDAVLALELVGDREAIQDRTCVEALDCVVRIVRGQQPGQLPGQLPGQVSGQLSGQLSGEDPRLR